MNTSGMSASEGETETARATGLQGMGPGRRGQPNDERPTRRRSGHERHRVRGDRRCGCRGDRTDEAYRFTEQKKVLKVLKV